MLDNDIKNRKYNKGEWSEILVCLIILSTKEWKIYYGDLDGKKTEDYLLIQNLYLDQPIHIKNKYHFVLNNNEYHLMHNGNLIKKYDLKKTSNIKQKLLGKIEEGKRAFKIEDTDIQDLFEEHQITKIKKGLKENQRSILSLKITTKINKKLDVILNHILERNLL